MSAFSATTRLYGVLKNSALSIISGVVWNAPGRVLNRSIAFSPVAHSQATASCDTFDRLTSASMEYFVPPWSPP